LNHLSSGFLMCGVSMMRPSEFELGFDLWPHDYAHPAQKSPFHSTQKLAYQPLAPLNWSGASLTPLIARRTITTNFLAT